MERQLKIIACCTKAVENDCCTRAAENNCCTKAVENNCCTKTVEMIAVERQLKAITAQGQLKMIAARGQLKMIAVERQEQRELLSGCRRKQKCCSEAGAKRIAAWMQEKRKLFVMTVKRR